MMTIDEFKRLEDAYRISKPSIFRLASPDPPASAEQISSVETAIKCLLPESYRQFLASCGGGDYALFLVFSANPDSEYYLPRRLEELRPLIGGGLLPFHDDEAGGLYVLRINHNVAAEAVYYLDWETQELSGPEYESVIDAVANRAFS